MSGATGEEGRLAVILVADVVGSSRTRGSRRRLCAYCHSRGCMTTMAWRLGRTGETRVKLNQAMRAAVGRRKRVLATVSGLVPPW